MLFQDLSLFIYLPLFIFHNQFSFLAGHPSTSLSHCYLRNEQQQHTRYKDATNKLLDRHITTKKLGVREAGFTTEGTEKKNAPKQKATPGLPTLSSSTSCVFILDITKERRVSCHSYHSRTHVSTRRRLRSESSS